MSFELLARLQQLETEVAYRSSPPDGTPPFVHHLGKRPVLISAPHATCHSRNNSRKMEEEFTYSFAKHLAMSTGCHAFLNRWETTEDPNWDSQSVYKNELAAVVQAHHIEFVIDLHGMTNRHNIGIAVGTINGRSCPDHELDLQQAFLRNQFCAVAIDELEGIGERPGDKWRRLVMNHPRFTGGVKSHTVTRFVVDELQIPAAQVELTSAARIPYRAPHDGWPFHYFGQAEAIHATTQALEAFISTFD